MNLAKLVSLGIALLFIQACSHPIEIEGQGDVMSASGTRTCLLEDFQAGEDVCKKNYAIGAYQETYYPTAKSGWKFDHWVTYCTTAIPPNYECVFNIPAEQVKKFWGQTMPPLKAVFTMDGIPIADFVTVNDKEWAQTDVLSNTNWDELNAACPPPTHACAGVVGGFNLNGWTWASVDEVNTLFNHFIGSAELGPGADGFATPGEYDLWTQFMAAGWHMNSISPGGLALFRGWTSTQVDTDYGYIGTVALREPDCDFETAEFPNYTCTGSSTEALTNQTRPKNGVQFDPNAQDIWPSAFVGTWLYRAAPGTPITGDNVVLANGKEWAQVDLFTYLSWDQINAVCPAGVCADGGVLNGYDMTGWTWASVAEVNELFNHYIGSDVLGPSPDDSWACGSGTLNNCSTPLYLSNTTARDGWRWVVWNSQTCGAPCGCFMADIWGWTRDLRLDDSSWAWIGSFSAGTVAVSIDVPPFVAYGMQESYSHGTNMTQNYGNSTGAFMYRNP